MSASCSSLDDRVATTGTVWLGLTIGCAQCHDHKFDPIEQKEYYRLFAFLNNQDEPTLKVFDSGVDVSGLTAEFKKLETEIAAFMKEHTDELAEWESGLTPEIKKSLSSAIVKTLAVPKEKRSFAQLRTLFAGGIGGVGPFRQLNDRYTELDVVLNQGASTMVLRELTTPRKTTVFIKGDFTRPGDEVAPGTPAVLHPMDQPSGRPNRLDLAKWLVSPRNPLTARVIMSRIWQQYFGRGIVETENDFGMQGAAPSHPELLDWLAVEFVDVPCYLSQKRRPLNLARRPHYSQRGPAPCKTIPKATTKLRETPPAWCILAAIPPPATAPSTRPSIAARPFCSRRSKRWRRATSRSPTAAARRRRPWR